MSPPASHQWSIAGLFQLTPDECALIEAENRLWHETMNPPGRPYDRLGTSRVWALEYAAIEQKAQDGDEGALDQILRTPTEGAFIALQQKLDGIRWAKFQREHGQDYLKHRPMLERAVEFFNGRLESYLAAVTPWRNELQTFGPDAVERELSSILVELRAALEHEPARFETLGMRVSRLAPVMDPAVLPPPPAAEAAPEPAPRKRSIAHQPQHDLVDVLSIQKAIR